jgi:hypothetical protein
MQLVMFVMATSMFMLRCWMPGAQKLEDTDSCMLLQNPVSVLRQQYLQSETSCQDLLPLLASNRELLHEMCQRVLPTATCAEALKNLGAQPSHDVVAAVCQQWTQATAHKVQDGIKDTSLALSAVNIADTDSYDIRDLVQYEKKIYSQNGEDGITLELLKRLYPSPSPEHEFFYVEFGVESGSECNTRVLRESSSSNGHIQWKGLLMDGGYENAAINLKKEFITRENIVSLFQKYDVPKRIQLLSIDLDRNDLYVANEIVKAGYVADIIVVEYNSYFLPSEDKTVEYDAKKTWDHTNYFGVSLLAYKKFLNHYNYSMVYCNANGVNAFFVNRKILEQYSDKFAHVDDIEYLYRKATYGPGPRGGWRADTQHRKFVASSDVMQAFLLSRSMQQGATVQGQQLDDALQRKDSPPLKGGDTITNNYYYGTAQPCNTSNAAPVPATGAAANGTNITNATNASSSNSTNVTNSSAANGTNASLPSQTETTTTTAVAAPVEAANATANTTSNSTANTSAVVDNSSSLIANASAPNATNTTAA